LQLLSIRSAFVFRPLPSTVMVSAVSPANGNELPFVFGPLARTCAQDDGCEGGPCSCAHAAPPFPPTVMVSAVSPANRDEPSFVFGPLARTCAQDDGCEGGPCSCAHAAPPFPPTVMVSAVSPANRDEPSFVFGPLTRTCAQDDGVGGRAIARKGGTSYVGVTPLILRDLPLHSQCPQLTSTPPASARPAHLLSTTWPRTSGS